MTESSETDTANDVRANIPPSSTPKKQPHIGKRTPDEITHQPLTEVKRPKVQPDQKSIVGNHDKPDDPQVRIHSPNDNKNIRRNTITQLSKNRN